MTTSTVTQEPVVHCIRQSFLTLLPSLSSPFPYTYTLRVTSRFFFFNFFFYKQSSDCVTDLLTNNGSMTPVMGSWCLSYLMSCPSEEAPASLPASPHTPAEGALHGSLEMGDLRLISSPPGGVDGLGFPLLPRPPTKSRFNSLFQNKSSLALPTHNNNNSNNNNGST